MGFFDNLRAKLFTGKLKKRQIERLEVVIHAAILDGQIPEHELNYINVIYADNELTPHHFSNIKDEIFVQLVNQSISDRRVDERERSAINQLTGYLRIGADVQSWAERQMRHFEPSSDRIKRSFASWPCYRLIKGRP
jgi:uncharacterized membrane protein YebE (DUF533 family)